MLTQKKLIEKMRNEDDIKLFFEHLPKLQSSTGTEEPYIPRRKRAPKRFEIGDGIGYHADSVEELYKNQYYEALDWPLLASKINLSNQVMQCTKIWRCFF